MVNLDSWQWRSQRGFKDENKKLSIEREEDGCYFDLPFRFSAKDFRSILPKMFVFISRSLFTSYVKGGKVVRNCQLLPLASLELKKPALIECQH